MPQPLTIWTEGIHDIKFLSDVLMTMNPTSLLTFTKDRKVATLLSEEVDIKILEAGGISAYNTQSGYVVIMQRLEDEKTTGRTNLFIIDADQGYEEQRNRVSSAMGTDYSENSLFLWPRNGEQNERSANHDLEMLLVDIIQPQHRQIFDCWEQYETCLPDNYTKPATKTKIYGFFEANHPSTKKGKDLCKEPNRNYMEDRLWDLNHNALDPLKTFLNRHLI